MNTRTKLLLAAFFLFYPFIALAQIELAFRFVPSLATLMMFLLGSRC